MRQLIVFGRCHWPIYGSHALKFRKSRGWIEAFGGFNLAEVASGVESDGCRIEQTPAKLINALTY